MHPTNSSDESNEEHVLRTFAAGVRVPDRCADDVVVRLRKLERDVFNPIVWDFGFVHGGMSVGAADEITCRI
jgi:acyl-coenzyme A thioesterase PaaI-like protein